MSPGQCGGMGDGRMRVIRPTKTTNPMIVNYVVQWLDHQTPQEVAQKAQADFDLVADLAPYAGLVKAAKRLVALDVDRDSLLVEIAQKRPAHAQVLMNHRDWYDRQIAALQTYIEGL